MKTDIAVEDVKRKPRTWAVTPDAMKTLGRGAKQLARKSASQLSNPGVKTCIGRLHDLFEFERTCKLKQGDVLIELIDHHHLRPMDIARETRQRPNDLSQMYHTCRTFPPKARRKEVPYNIYFLATRMVRKFKHLQLEPMAVLEEILRLGFTQHRDVTRHFWSKMRQEESDRVGEVAYLNAPAQPFDRAYHARFQILLQAFPDHSIKVLHIDPPYIYPGQADGRYAASSSHSLNCDGASEGEAIATVNDLLRDWQIKLAPGGVLLLWQASGPMHKAISSAIDKHHWQIERVVIWDKGRAQAGDFQTPYSTQTEWLWVLKRPGDRLVNHDNSSRGDVLRFAPVSLPSLAGSQQHAFEKPIDLCKFLISKHSHVGELVLDCCGCTAAMSTAAAELNRPFVYIESNAANYQLGSQRIARQLAGRSLRAG